MSYFDVLGLTENASFADVKRAYKHLALKCHPDKGGDTDAFLKVKTAYSAIESARKKNKNKNPESEGNQNQNQNQNENGSDGVNIKFLLDALITFIKGLMDKTQRDIYVKLPVTLEDLWYEKSKKISIKVKRLNVDNLTLIETVEDFYISLYEYQKVYTFVGRGDDCIFKRFLSGDVIVELDIQKHEYLNIDNIFNMYDLYMNYSIDLVDFYTKNTLTIPFLNGNEIDVEFNMNKLIKVTNNGLPYNDQRGDLTIYIDVVLPDSFDSLKQRIFDETSTNAEQKQKN